jgi:phosphate starvation-inducible PhoH-like protein
MDDNLKTIEKRLGVEISYRGNQIKIVGKESNCVTVSNILKDLYVETSTVKNEQKNITDEMVHLAIVGSNALEQEASPSNLDVNFDKLITIKTKRGVIKPRNINQQSYVHNVITNDISFGVGVAGTGKTYLAVACAV